MKFLIIPVALITLLYLAKVACNVGSDIILPGAGIDVQERISYHAAQWGLEVALVKAFAKVESNFNPKAKNPDDPSFGLMQITPGLAYDYGGIIRNWKNPSESEIEMLMDIDNNLTVACWFLNRLGKYDFQQQIMSYNVGERGYKDGRRNYSYFNKVRGYYETYS